MEVSPIPNIEITCICGKHKNLTGEQIRILMRNTKTSGELLKCVQKAKEMMKDE